MSEITVIVPTYNRRELLRRALDSLAQQTFTDFEAVVVNDGGQAVTDIVEEYPQARLITHPWNRGLPAARNTGLKEARGEWIAYLDDDDWYYPIHLEALLAFATANTDRRIVYSNAHAIERSGGRLFCSMDYSPEALLDHNITPVDCVLHQKSLIDEAGPFDESLPNHEDWDMWLRIAQITPLHHLAQPTCAIDRTQQTMNSDRPAMLTGYALIKQRYSGARLMRLAYA